MCFEKPAHLVFGQRREVEGYRTRADGRQQVVRILRRQDERQGRNGLLERLQKRIGCRFGGLVGVGEDEDPLTALGRCQTGLLAQVAGLVDRNELGWAVGREDEHVRVDRDHEGHLLALRRRHFLAFLDLFQELLRRWVGR